MSDSTLILFRLTRLRPPQPDGARLDARIRGASRRTCPSIWRATLLARAALRGPHSFPQAPHCHHSQFRYARGSAGRQPHLCTVAFDGPIADLRFLGAANTETPTCTGCGTPLEKWPDAVSEWYSNPSAFSLTCSGCGSVRQLWDLNWHRTNAFARFGIDFWHVYPGQAIPTPSSLSS